MYENVEISSKVVNNIIRTIGRKPPETGGVLLGPIGEDRITHFIFDKNGSVTSCSYSPSHTFLTNICIKLSKKGYELKGFCHSHPNGNEPSYGDMVYVKKFFDVNPCLKKFYLPIFLHNNVEQLNFWVVFRQSCPEYSKAKITINDTPKQALNIDLIKQNIPNIQIDSSITNFGSLKIKTLRIKLKSSEISFLLPTEFPILSPTVFLTNKFGSVSPIAHRWDIRKNESPEEKIINLINIFNMENKYEIRKNHYM